MKTTTSRCRCCGHIADLVVHDAPYPYGLCLQTAAHYGIYLRADGSIETDARTPTITVNPGMGNRDYWSIYATDEQRARAAHGLAARGDT